MCPVATGRAAEEAVAQHVILYTLSSALPTHPPLCLKGRITPRTCFAFVFLVFPPYVNISAEESSGRPSVSLLRKFHMPPRPWATSLSFTFGPKGFLALAGNKPAYGCRAPVRFYLWTRHCGNWTLGEEGEERESWRGREVGSALCQDQTSQGDFSGKRRARLWHTACRPDSCTGSLSSHDCSR